MDSLYSWHRTFTQVNIHVFIQNKENPLCDEGDSSRLTNLTLWWQKHYQIDTMSQNQVVCFTSRPFWLGKSLFYSWPAQQLLYHYTYGAGQWIPISSMQDSYNHSKALCIPDWLSVNNSCHRPTNHLIHVIHKVYYKHVVNGKAYILQDIAIFVWMFVQIQRWSSGISLSCLITFTENWLAVRMCCSFDWEKCLSFIGWIWFSFLLSTLHGWSSVQFLSAAVDNTISFTYCATWDTQWHTVRMWYTLTNLSPSYLWRQGASKF